MAADKSARVTYEDAKPVIQTLIAAGKERPSAKDLYDAMKRGSVATHQKHIARFREEEQPIRAAELAMPVEAQEFYLTVLRRQVAEAKKELEVELMELRQSNTALIEESERLQDELDEGKSHIVLVSGELQQKVGTINQLNEELARLRESLDRTKDDAKLEINNVESAARERIARAEDAAQREMETMRTESEKIRQEAGGIRAALARAELRLEALPRLEAEIDRLRDELTSERNAKFAAQQLKAVAEARVEELQVYRAELESTRNELKQMQVRRLELETSFAALSARFETEQKFQAKISSDASVK